MKSTKPHVTGVFHPVIVVSDMQNALGFYRDLLGLRITFDQIHDPEMAQQLTGYVRPDVRAVVLEAPDGTEIELAEFRRPRGRTRASYEWADAGINSVTFRVADLAGLVANLSEAGIRFMSEIVTQELDDGAKVKVVYCYGPDDVVITLGEMPVGRRTLGGER